MSLKYPDGYTPRREPHCGVLAVAICAGVTFETAWETVKRVGKHGARWKGMTYCHDREGALKALGVPFKARTHVAANLLPKLPPAWGDKQFLPGCTAAGFAKRLAKPGVSYMLRVGGHVLTLRDGMLADQNGIAPADKHRCARKRVTHSIIIGENA